jgi:hypothetical protein
MLYSESDEEDIWSAGSVRAASILSVCSRRCGKLLAIEAYKDSVSVAVDTKAKQMPNFVIGEADRRFIQPMAAVLLSATRNMSSSDGNNCAPLKAEESVEGTKPRSLSAIKSLREGSMAR